MKSTLSLIILLRLYQCVFGRGCAYLYNLSADTIFSKCCFSVSSSSGVNISGSVAILLNESKDVEECLRFMLEFEVLPDAIDDDVGISVMSEHVALLVKKFQCQCCSCFLLLVYVVFLLFII